MAITLVVDRIAAPVITGLAAGTAFIVLFSTVGTSSLSHYSHYDLGAKDALVSKLSEYFASEPDNAVQIANETFFDAEDIYVYKLVATHDSKAYGILRIFTYPDERVSAASIAWEHNGDPNLKNAADLLVSGIADNTIPDWQMGDDQPNRNTEILEWIYASNDNKTSNTKLKDDFSQQRELYVEYSEDAIILAVSAE